MSAKDKAAELARKIKKRSNIAESQSERVRRAAAAAQRVKKNPPA